MELIGFRWSDFREIRLVKFPFQQNLTRITSTLHVDQYNFLLLLCGAAAPTRAMASSFTRLLDHTQRRTTVGRTPLDEWSARRRDLYLTTYNTRNRQTSMPPVGFEPTVSACERPQTYALDRAATGTGVTKDLWFSYWAKLWTSRSNVVFSV